MEKDYLEMLFNTDKEVSILRNDVDSIKNEVREFKKDYKESSTKMQNTLDKILNEPAQDMIAIRKNIRDWIIKSVLILAIVGLCIAFMQKSNEINKISAEYKEITAVQGDDK